MILSAGAAIVCLCLFFSARINARTYSHALLLLEEGKYSECISSLKMLPQGYKDRNVLINYASARAVDSLEKKYKYMQDVPNNYQGDFRDEILAYKTNIEAEYHIFKEEEKIKAEEKAQREEEERKQREEEKKAKDAVTYPYYGMREESLGRCALGKPTVEPCRDFYKLRKSHQSKTYTFGERRKPNSGSVTVRYQRHLSNKVDDYIEYPSSNGYADSGYYYDADGVRYDFDFEGTEITYPSDYRPDASKPLYSDPYDTDKYDDPEDFYYDWYDDFDDYEDAEDYWDEHHS